MPPSSHLDSTADFFTEEQLVHVQNFATSSLPSVVPIEQIDPARMRADTMGMKINEFGDIMPYWHGYPELQGYVRHGNGRPLGDDGYFVLSAVAGPAGLGTLYIQFPPARNSIDRNPNGGRLGAYDGLFHSGIRGFVRGFNVFLMSDSIDVNFGPERGTRYTQEIPLMLATAVGLYVTFHGVPGTRYDFLLNRQVIYGTVRIPDPPRPIPAPDAPDKPDSPKSDL